MKTFVQFRGVENSATNKQFFFSQVYPAIQRQRQTERGQLEEPMDEIPEEDLRTLESKIVFNNLRQTVLRDMTVHHHPIEVGIRKRLRAIKGKQTSNTEVI